MTPEIDVNTDEAEQDEHCADHVAKYEIPALPEPLPLTRRRPFSKMSGAQIAIMAKISITRSIEAAIYRHIAGSVRWEHRNKSAIWAVAR